MLHAVSKSILPPSSQGSPHSTILISWLPASAAQAPPPLGKSQLSHNHRPRGYGGAQRGDAVLPGARRCWPALSPPRTSRRVFSPL